MKKHIFYHQLSKEEKVSIKTIFEDIKKKGFLRARVDNKIVSLRKIPKLEKNKNHDIDVLIDRVVLEKSIQSRLLESVELALKMGNGICIININRNEDYSFSEHFACAYHPYVMMTDLTPRMFSFNSHMALVSNVTDLVLLLKLTQAWLFRI